MLFMKEPAHKKFNIAIFASGAGSNAQKIIDHFKNSSTAAVSLLVCNKPEAGVLHIAQNEGIPHIIISREQFSKGNGYVPELQAAGIDLIVLAGFLWKVPQALVDAFPKRIINIHPALLPKYGGKGMYGHHVHNAVATAGEAETGITIHYVDEHYDNGDIIFQVSCPVEPTDDPHSISKKVQVLEHTYFPKVVEEVVNELLEEGLS